MQRRCIAHSSALNSHHTDETVAPMPATSPAPSLSNKKTLRTGRCRHAAYYDGGDDTCSLCLRSASNLLYGSGFLLALHLTTAPHLVQSLSLTRYPPFIPILPLLSCFLLLALRLRPLRPKLSACAGIATQSKAVHMKQLWQRPL